MVRLIEDVLHLARLHDLTAVHYKDSAAGTRNDAKIVRDQDNGCTVGSCKSFNKRSTCA